MTKKIITTLLSLTLFVSSFAQNEQYISAMKGFLVKLKEAKTPESFQSVANGFERIAELKKTNGFQNITLHFAM